MYKKCIAFMMSMVLVLLPLQGLAETAAGTSTNLSLTATASSNYEYPAKNDVSGNAIDGNMDTMWTGKNVNDWWLKIELKKAAEIEKVDLSFSYGTKNMKCYFLEYSDDGEEWKTLEGAYQGRTGSSAPFNNIFIPSKKIITQYIRLTNSVSSPLIYPKINEVAIYGTEITDPTLSTLAVSGKELSPAFDPDTLYYTCELEADESIPQVTAVGADDVTVAIEQANPKTMCATVTVSSIEHPGSKQIYTVSFLRNLSLGATATANGGTPSLAIDGDPETSWSYQATDYYIDIKLNKVTKVDSVKLLYNSVNNLANRLATLKYSDNGSTWTEIGNGWSDKTATKPGESDGRPFWWTYTLETPIYTQYIRLENTNGLQQYSNMCEIKIYGEEIPDSKLTIEKVQLYAGGAQVDTPQVGPMSVEVTAVSNVREPVAFMLIAATYRGSELKKVDLVDMPYTAEEYSKPFTATVNFEEGDTLRYFVWEANTLIPVNLPDAGSES